MLVRVQTDSGLLLSATGKFSWPILYSRSAQPYCKVPNAVSFTSVIRLERFQSKKAASPSSQDLPDCKLSCQSLQ